ncbi:hypothetical protein HYU19_03305 [Candidatus Woesearchaeota archaeon]|nr:hypothetical protein [Candidatus Woesearchaeota archaeon]
MKHSLQITCLLVGLFFITQIVGLFTISNSDYLQVFTTINETTGEKVTTVSYEDTFIGEPIQVAHKNWSGVYLLIGVLIGTSLLFLLIKLRVGNFWKYWFLLSVFITLAISVNVYVSKLIAVLAAAGFSLSAYLSKPIAALLAAGFSLWKVYRPNVIVHNITEIFIYTGITIIFLPIFSIFSVIVLLVLISIYDMIAVWKSGHMVELARFQAKSNIFAGLLIPYKLRSGGMKRLLISKQQGKKQKPASSEGRTAILGGGDIAFPLLFSSTVMVDLLQSSMLSIGKAFLMSSIIALATTASLFLLLYFAKKDKFYPAMPFISLGCLAGYGLVLLLLWF